jgi:hypothetical protein
VSAWEKIFSFSTTVAFLFVAVWIDQPIFFVAAAFAAVVAVAELYRERYPREARTAIWVGRIGIVVTLAYVISLVFRG